MLSLGITPSNLFKKSEDEEVSEDLADKIFRQVKKDAGGTGQEPPEEPKWKKVLEAAEKTTYDVAEKRWTKKAVNALKKQFDNKAWKEKTIVTGSYAKGNRKVSIPGENIDFFKDLNSYANEKHGGVLKPAIKEITGTDDPKEINNISTKIQSAAKRRGFKFELQGLNLPQDLLIEGE